jgi:flagellar FliJ protein
VPPPKRFIFRLEMVLGVKIKKEEEEKRKLGERIAELKEAEQVLVNLQAALVDNRQRLKNAQVTGQYLSIDELKRITNYIKKLDKDIEYQKVVVKQREEAVELQRMALLEAAREKKTLEMLKEQQYNDWVKEVEEDEARTLDELATLKYAREGALAEEEM